MPDISLRFHRSMLVISSPLEPLLDRQGFDCSKGLEFAGLVEPEAIRDALRLNSVVGAQCLATNTRNVTPARLAQARLDGRAEEVVDAALELMPGLRPQHVLIELAPCGLPLDSSSKGSLMENKDQYVRAARAFAGRQFDAFYLSGFSNAVDLKCALMGIRQVSDAPIMASVRVDASGSLPYGSQTMEEAFEAMREYGASVAGICVSCPIEEAVALTKRAVALAGELPVLVEVEVARVDAKQLRATADNPYYCADVMMEAGVKLRAAGAQFLRATGQATPAFTGALMAATEGLDAIRPDIALD